VGRLAFWALSFLLRLTMLLLIVVSVAGAALAWRLSQGPFSLPQVTDALESYLRKQAPDLRLDIGVASIAWEGWQDGTPLPLTLRLDGLRALDEAGNTRAALTSAQVSLSIPELLRLHVAPTKIVVRDPVAMLRRDETGAIALDLGAPPEITGPSAPAGPEAGPDMLANALRAPAADSPLVALRELSVTGGAIQVRDELLQISWALGHVDLSLTRAETGEVETTGAAALHLAGQEIPVRISGRAAGDPVVAEAALDIAEVSPAALATALPSLRPLAALDAIVSARFEARYNFGDGSFRGRTNISTGPGRITARGQLAPFETVQATLSGDGRRIVMERLELRLPAGRPGSPASTLTATAQAMRQGDTWRGRLEIGLDHMAVEDLGLYWPPGVAEGGRRWVTENLTAGFARDGRWWMEGEAQADFTAPRVMDAGGTVEVEAVTVHWLRPIPPLEGAEGTVTFSMQDIVIQARATRQSGLTLTVPEARIRLHDLAGPIEKATIDARVTGPLADVVALVRHPRLHLFDNRPLALKQPGGTVDTNLSISLPLLNELPIEDLRIQVQGKLANGRLADLVAGQPLERAQLDIALDTAGMRLSGTGNLGPIPARLQAELDFRSGPPSQVTERVRAEGRAEATSLRAFGVDAEPYLRGPLGYALQVERRRSGETRLALRSDLRDARVELAPLSYVKAPGAPATAEGTLVLQRDSVAALQDIRVEGPDLLVRGGLSFGPQSRLSRAEILEARIGTSRVTGTVISPAGPGAPYQIRVRGALLDAGALLRDATKESAGGRFGGRDSGRLPPLRLDAAFDRVLLSEGRELAPVQAALFLDGDGVLRELRASGRSTGGGFDAAIAPRGAGRALEIASNDFGGLLSGAGLLGELDGGRLRVVGNWPSNSPNAPLSGTVEMTEFGVRDAPVIGKILQALSIYGIPDATRGPGLRFARLHAPFALTEEALALSNAQAFSSSLGITARGRFMRREERLDMQGTVVPSYALNSALGRIPGIGRLFSSEAGGGLFALSFRVTGPLDDPDVSVNPLSALAPGALRGLFTAQEPPEAAPAR
jgi:hypothetical protein